MAVILSLSSVVVEIGLTWWRGEKLSTFFKFTALITVVFGSVDLYLQQSLLFKYEATLTTIMVGVFFGSTLFADKSLIQEFAEQQGRVKGPMSMDRVIYFRFLTIIWSLYFFIKAAIYFKIASNSTLEQGFVIRAVVGNISRIHSFAP
jgi:intracellular septation protein A